MSYYEVRHIPPNCHDPLCQNKPCADSAYCLYHSPVREWERAEDYTYAAPCEPEQELDGPAISRELDKSDAMERKATPLYSGFVAYFPDAMAAVARLSHIANEQHNPGEPMHWARGKSMDHEDCIMRHLADHASGTEVDTDGQLHLTKVAWRAMAALQIYLEKADEGKESDDRAS